MEIDETNQGVFTENEVLKYWQLECWKKGTGLIANRLQV